MPAREETSSSEEPDYQSDSSFDISIPADEMDRSPSPPPPVQRKTFPRLLHLMLEDAEEKGFTDIVSWQPHGRCFRVHKAREFVVHCMPKLFDQTKWSSFQRQLNLYGFQRVPTGPDKGAYYHDKFLRGQPSLSDSMVRTKVKGTKVRVASNKEQTPNFYDMPALDDPLLSAEESSFGTFVESDMSHMGVSLDDSMTSQVGGSQEENSAQGSTAADELALRAIHSLSPIRSQSQKKLSRKSNKKDRRSDNRERKKKERVLLGLDELSLRNIFDYTPTCREPPSPASSIEDVPKIPDDPEKLQEIYALLGKPFNLDDLDSLPQDESGWGALLDTAPNSSKTRKKRKQVTVS